MGNKEARSLLVRDRNKIVAIAAVTSPKITDHELITIAQSRNVCDEVLRMICRNNEPTRAYLVKLALATNPKTPQATAMQFTNYLQDEDELLAGVTERRLIFGHTHLPFERTRRRDRAGQPRLGRHAARRRPPRRVRAAPPRRDDRAPPRRLRPRGERRRAARSASTALDRRASLHRIRDARLARRSGADDLEAGRRRAA